MPAASSSPLQNWRPAVGRNGSCWLADSVEDYLAFCAERGEAPDQPFSGRFTVRLSPEQHRKVILAAEKAGKDVAQWVAEALEQATGSTGH
jgi:predicted HicB family RNase H-like nuclease